MHSLSSKIFDETDALLLTGGDSRERACKEFLVVRVLSKDVDVAESGTAVVVGCSQETHLVALTGGSRGRGREG